MYIQHTPPMAIIPQPPQRLTAMAMGDDQGRGWHTKKAPSFCHNGPEMAIRIKYILLVFFVPKPHEKTEKMAPRFFLQCVSFTYM